MSFYSCQANGLPMCGADRVSALVMTCSYTDDVTQAILALSAALSDFQLLNGPQCSVGFKGFV